MGEVTVNLKEFNSSAAWGISPFSSNPALPECLQGQRACCSPANQLRSVGRQRLWGHSPGLNPDLITFLLDFG